MELYFVTSNKNKLKELRMLVSNDIIEKALDLDEIQSIDAGKVAGDKVRRAYEIIKAPVIVEDTGLYFTALKGFPGALSKWMEVTVGLEGMCRMLDSYKDRSARAETCIGYYNGKELKVFKGEVEGKIAVSPKGTDGFGWDSIFIPDGYDKTFAELGIQLKNTMSHRMKAASQLKAYLEKKE